VTDPGLRSSTLTRYGATHFGYMTEPGRPAIAFRMNNLQVRFTLPLPDRAERQFTHIPTGRLAVKAAQDAKYEQAIRQKWHALALVVKAKPEALESGMPVSSKSSTDISFYRQGALCSTTRSSRCGP
jgi:hypothetical protein